MHDRDETERQMAAGRDFNAEMLAEAAAIGPVEKALAERPGAIVTEMYIDRKVSVHRDRRGRGAAHCTGHYYETTFEFDRSTVTVRTWK